MAHGGTHFIAALIAFASPGISQPIRAAPVVPAGTRFQCTPVAVWDGDGPIWCAEGPKLRLAGVAAREMDGSCRSGQPCPSATAEAARDALVRLLGGPTGRLEHGHIAVRGPALRCMSEGQGKGDRTAAWCTLPNGKDVSCQMVATGTVLRWERYDPSNRCRQRWRLW